MHRVCTQQQRFLSRYCIRVSGRAIRLVTKAYRYNLISLKTCSDAYTILGLTWCLQEQGRRHESFQLRRAGGRKPCRRSVVPYFLDNKHPLRRTNGGENKLAWRRTKRSFTATKISSWRCTAVCSGNRGQGGGRRCQTFCPSSTRASR